MEVETVCEAGDGVGESVVWDDRRGRLAWVDITGRRVHLLDPGSGAHHTHGFAEIVTSIGLCDDGRAILGLAGRVALWDWEGEVEPLARIEPDLPGNRLNEGVVGPDGAFWVGTMANNIGPDGEPVQTHGKAGRIWRIPPGGTPELVTGDRFAITNTFVWTDDGALITADTPADTLYRYPLDRAAGRLGERAVFQSGFGRGLPDGSCLDAAGFLWTARHGGGCLARTDRSGGVTELVELPCRAPTSCAFGGPGLATLYVTSARFGLGAAHLAANPQEGALFALTPGVTGRPANRFAAAG